MQSVRNDGRPYANRVGVATRPALLHNGAMQIAQPDRAALRRLPRGRRAARRRRRGPRTTSQSLDPVVVTATRSAARAFDLPASVDIIDGRTHPRRPAADQPVRDAAARARRLRREPQELCAGPADQLARLRRARDLRRARRAALPGRHPGRRCPTARARPAASACCPPSASRCCAARSRRCTATRRAASSPCSPRRRAIRRSRAVTRGRRQLRRVERRRAAVGGRPGGVGYVVAGKPLRDRRLSRAFSARRAISATRSSSFDAGARHAHHDHRQLAVPAGDAGSARAHARAVGGESAPGRPGGDCSSTRARRSTRQQAGVAVEQRLRRPTLTLDGGAYGGRRLVRQYLALSGVGADVVGRRHRPRPRLRRRGRCASRGAARRRRAADGRRAASTRSPARAATRLRQRQRRPRRPAARRGRRRPQRRRATSRRSGRRGRRGRSPRACAAATCATRPTITSSAPQNPDDSGARSFRDTSPVLGAVWHATDSVNVYAQLRRGLRDADVRRARLPHRRHRAQLRPRAGDAAARPRSASRRSLGPRQRVDVAVFAVRHAQRDRRSTRRPVAARRSRTRATRAAPASRRSGPARCRST